MSGDDSWGYASDSNFKQLTPSLRANGSHECAPDEAKQSIEQQERKNGLLRRIRLRPKAGFGGQECSSQ
jgi:hypothetical protein